MAGSHHRRGRSATARPGVDARPAPLTARQVPRAGRHGRLLSAGRTGGTACRRGLGRRQGRRGTARRIGRHRFSGEGAHPDHRRPPDRGHCLRRRAGQPRRPAVARQRSECHCSHGCSGACNANTESARIGWRSTRGAAMAGVESRNFDSPDETRTPDKTRVEVVRMGGTTAGRIPSSPGGAGRNASSPSPGPTVARHAMSGSSIRPTCDEARGRDRGRDRSGRGVLIEPGHDAWVVGDDSSSGSSSSRDGGGIRQGLKRASANPTLAIGREAAVGSAPMGYTIDWGSAEVEGASS